MNYTHVCASAGYTCILVLHITTLTPDYSLILLSSAAWTDWFQVDQVHWNDPLETQFVAGLSLFMGFVEYDENIENHFGLSFLSSKIVG